jgi:hypothetical protein
MFCSIASIEATRPMASRRGSADDVQELTDESHAVRESLGCGAAERQASRRLQALPLLAKR